MGSHIAYGIKFICYSRPDDAAEVTWNILCDHNVNQFLHNFVFFVKTMTNFFHIFIFHKKCLFSSRNSTSSFEEQDLLWIHLWSESQLSKIEIMSCIGTSGKFDSCLSLFMTGTCAPVSGNNFNSLLLTIQLTVHISPTNSATTLVSFTVNIAE